MASYISKRFSLPAFTSDKHPIKFVKNAATPNKRRSHGEVFRKVLAVESPSNSTERTTRDRPSTILSRSIDRLEERSVKALKKLRSKFTKKFFGKRRDAGQPEGNRQTTVANDEFIFDFEQPCSSSAAAEELFGSMSTIGDSFFGSVSAIDDESTLSTMSWEDGCVLDEEAAFEEENELCKAAIRRAVRETAASVQATIAGGLDSVRGDVNVKYSKAVQQKRNDFVRLLEETHNSVLAALGKMEDEIEDAIRRNEECAKKITGYFSATLDDNRVFLKRMEKLYEKTIKVAEDKIQKQREIIRSYEAMKNQGDRDDVLDH
ncbi:unnamed protein product [Phyllotreta striolata]|uniref:Uncharacterized protein n=1 Tax=Phyllotreta striolata TaxID=444603 RepID=A0A9N9XTN9_PHYSR|nr:unnamed protein product [Phyllotreta striolata]